MTLLKNFSIDDNVEIQVYEAPYHLSKGKQRRDWVFNEIPFFDKKLHDFWKLYFSPLKNEKGILLSEKVVMSDRKNFIRKPITICFDDFNQEVIGGIWFGPAKRTKKGLHGVFHIKFNSHRRKYAYPLLDYVGNQLVRYDAIYSEWGERLPEDDPSKFFEKNGFKIKKSYFYSSAIKNLK